MPLGHRIEDLKLPSLAVGTTRPEDRLATVTALFIHTERYTIEAIDWYLTKRRRPAQWSRLLRSIAVSAAVVGGIIPLVHGASPDLIAPDWGFVLLAIGAGCVLFDRVFGHSTSWSRFSRTGIALQHALARAQSEWVSAVVTLDPVQPGKEELRELLAVVERLHSKVHEIMQEETTGWIGYLAEGLEELNSTTVSRSSGSVMPGQTTRDP
ncbi:SLATT domain-containing protein [Kitasatospora xanthocidica]|uniref:SLATT domain-containing protein n=1 Tax=Kitasatospora xanthocidica TaxID=83382 RepID=A0A372ZPL9_9ACTN|nr:SLATT domain-containing protein [Kitasatospora xanthocidica]RGD57849.1 SLATT domain-containing protein [Kitasatospora xanthocidica]